MNSTLPTAEALSRRDGLDLIRARLLASVAPSHAHTLRGLLNIVVLSGELVRLSAAGSRDGAVTPAAGEALRCSTTRFCEAFDGFLNHLVTPDLGDPWYEPARVLKEASALLQPLASERRISVEFSACPPGFPADLLPGSLVTVLAFVGVEILRDVADGGRVLFLATKIPPGAQFVVSGGPSRTPGSLRQNLPAGLEAAVAAFGGSRSTVAGSGFSFEIAVPA